MTVHGHSRLIEHLPKVRGEYLPDFDLARVTWFKVGGPAEVLFKPADADDLASFLARRPLDLPVTVIGVGSNLLVRDGGVAGVVVRLGRGFADIKAKGTEIEAGSGAMAIQVARAALEAETEGLEFLSGIPGTVGGSVRMNAGAYGVEMKDVVVRARAIDGAGKAHELAAADIGFSYRRTSIPEDWIVVAATLRGVPGRRDDIARRMAHIQKERETTQPLRIATGGSTFKNPPGAKAWQLIEQAGCRGLRRGGAMVSEKHCNFLINTGEATAADLEDLGEEVRRRVRETAGVDLEWEIRRIGTADPGKRRDSA
ncbi:UDP-N-acetylmuramate dehydrogenase [Shumkonia mesophila]|uniref:UDP-N-acetylmuramate dehydrogenase n=1 Tax=Shumkonia mesophila TaxID=2838854 RepID=UPI00293421FE|nr:UDP-N-acetylmuramate dehydrogenase [Shumkonia mesophila]